MSVFSYFRSFTVGGSSGLRTFTAPAVTIAAGKSAWSGLLGVLAAAELAADKLPFTPARVQPLGLVARAASGGICGAAIAGRAKRSRIVGAAVGAVGAVAAAFAGYRLRKYLTTSVHLPDSLVATIEDGFAFGLARFAND